MSSTPDGQLLAEMQRLVAEAEAEDSAHSSIITRVRLAHAKSMYVRACAMIRRAREAAASADEPVSAARAEEGPA